MEIITSKENPREDLTIEDRFAIIEAGEMECMICYPLSRNEPNLHWMTEKYEP